MMKQICFIRALTEAEIILECFYFTCNHSSK